MPQKHPSISQIPKFMCICYVKSQPFFSTHLTLKAHEPLCGIPRYNIKVLFYRAEDEPHPTVTPDGYVDNLAQAVDVFLKHRS